MGLRFSSMRIRQQSSRMPLRTDLECLNFLIFLFDLSDLIQLVANLKGLVAPFQHDEVDNIVKELKSGKSPGPDGFNDDFMKKYWIQEDFDDPCSSFFDHNLCLQSINGSYITLIPKVDNPTKDSDFRPISCPLMFLLKNAVFGCYLPLSGRGRELPFTCLGLPPSHMKPSTHDCLTLVTRVERRLVSTSIFLSQGGKLQMVNSVLSSLPTFYMCSIKFPVKIVNHIEKYRRHCLWKGRDLNGKKPALAAWKLVTKPKMKGGLGVIRLRLQNEALLLNFFA
jgi:hypothetical protein